jgi:hypothetical protein
MCGGSTCAVDAGLGGAPHLVHEPTGNIAVHMWAVDAKRVA